MTATYIDTDGTIYQARVVGRRHDGEASLEVNTQAAEHVFPLWVLVGALRMDGWTVEPPKGVK